MHLVDLGRAGDHPGQPSSTPGDADSTPVHPLGITKGDASPIHRAKRPALVPFELQTPLSVTAVTARPASRCLLPTADLADDHGVRMQMSGTCAGIVGAVPDGSLIGLENAHARLAFPGAGPSRCVHADGRAARQRHRRGLLEIDDQCPMHHAIGLVSLRQSRPSPPCRLPASE